MQQVTNLNQIQIVEQKYPNPTKSTAYNRKQLFGIK